MARSAQPSRHSHPRKRSVRIVGVHRSTPDLDLLTDFIYQRITEEYEGACDGESPPIALHVNARDRYARWGEPWTSAESQMLTDSYTRGLSLDEIAKVMGRTPAALRYQLDKLGVRRSKTKPDRAECTDDY